MPRTLARLFSEIPEHLRNTALTRTTKGSPEAAQAWIRVAIVPALFLYSLYAWINPETSLVAEYWRSASPFSLEGLVVAILAAAVLSSFLILGSILTSPDPSAIRRVLTYVHDYASLGVVIVLSEYTMSLFWVPVIWLSIGNGIRFGRRDVIVSSALGVLLIAVAWAFSPSWRAHPEMLSLVAAMQLLVPLYVTMMFGVRAREQSRQHQASFDSETNRLQAIAEAEATQAKTLAMSIDRHRATLTALTKELQDPVIAIRNSLLKQPSPTDSRDLLRQADLLQASIQTIQDIDAIVSGTVELVPTDAGAVIFATSLAKRLSLVASGHVTYGFADDQDPSIRLRLDHRWAENALYSIFRGPVTSAHRGQSFHIEFEIDWTDRDRGEAYLTATLHPAGDRDPSFAMPPDSQLSVDLGRRLLTILGGRYVTSITTNILAQVEIPVVASRPGPPKRLPKVQGSRPKVMVVDDNKSVLSTFGLYAEKLGYHPLPILHPERVPEAIIEHAPSFIFIDRHMPSLSGAELIARIRTSPHIPNPPPIVLFSSETDESVLEEARKLGVRFLPKPIRLESLRDILVEVVPGPI
jgi:two-component system sensor histidine kinase RpfC